MRFSRLKGGDLEQNSENTATSSGTHSSLTVESSFFFDTRTAWLWLIIRVYVGYQWFTAGWSKLTGHSIGIGSFGRPTRGGSWLFSTHSGIALKGFLTHAMAQTTGPIPQVQGWYAFFLQHVALPNIHLFAFLVTFGELLIGCGLLLGALTGIAAFFGMFLNFNYLLAGSVSLNPLLGTLSLLLVLAWRVSGYYGLDSYLLPLLGIPWADPLAGRLPETEYT
ncbi:MAG TPA: DoxX family protein [Ktedonobacteraceae bacterium]|nr:DoxX family protein [Ktedonobacteraceae bacterium]